MRFSTCLFVLLCTAGVFAQKTFEVRDASKYFDIKIDVAECDEHSCTGKASFAFYKKGGTVPYQTIDLPETYVQLNEDGTPLVNTTVLYDEQSVVNVGDFNFDGMEDVALCNGTNGAYGMPSYNIYLSSKVARKFVFSRPFTDLAHNLGMFEVDAKKKQLTTFGKSGCCWHVVASYSVMNNRPVKVFEEVADATQGRGDRIKITTKKRINGRWRTTVRYEKLID